MAKQKDDELYKQFQKWEQGRKEREQASQKVYQFVETQKTRMDNSAPVTLPREWVWAGVAVGALLILAQFPAMVLGIIVGAVLMLKLNNSWGK